MAFGVSRLDSVYAFRPRPYPLETIALEMRKGTGTLSHLHDAAQARTLAGVTAYARELRDTRGHAAYDEIKKTMPQFLPAVVSGSRSTAAIEAFSGLVCLEYDDDSIDTAYAFVLACQNPHVAMAWRSLSEKPKFLVRVAMASYDADFPLSPSTFPHAWVSASQLFEELGEADPAAARPLQPQNMCYDPDLYLNLDALPLEWSVDAEALSDAFPRGFDAVLYAEFSELGQEYLNAFSEMSFDEKGVGKVRVPCPFETHQHDGWGLRTNACRVIKHDAHDFTLKCFKCNESKRYNLTASKPSRYHVNREFIYETSDLDTERDANARALVLWLLETKDSNSPELLILGSAAGTGKTTVAMTTADHLLYISKTTEEADQVFKTLFDAEDDVYRHRPRLYNRDREDWNTLPLGLTENDRPCIEPELCNVYAERGHATHDVCHRCPLLSECQSDGYLSQDTKERNAKKVVYAWDEAFACDRIHTERVKRICTKADILIVDEVNPASLTQHRRLTREMLYDLTERFRDGNTATEFKTLKALLDLISTAEDEKAFIEGLRAEIDAIDDVDAFDGKLEKYPVGYVFSKAEENGFPYRFVATLDYRGKEVTVPVVSHETAVDTPVFEIAADTPITVDKWHLSFFPVSVLIKVGLAELSEPPRRFRRFLTDIKAFLEEHPNLQTAPFSFDAKAQVFDFHLKPTLNHRRAIFNTASDPDNLISEAYRDTDIHIRRHTGKTPAWKSRLVFQLSTGNYLPRHSLIGYEDNKKLHLKPRAEELINDYIKPSIAAGLKVLVVAPKAFQKVEGVSKWAATKRKDFQIGRNALLINHHHAEGRNDYQDFDLVFVFHYEPDHHSVQQNAKRLYRNPETPLDFTREKRTVTMGGVSFEKMIYIDERVQAVYNRECRERLMQSAMRLRPNIHAGKIIVFLTAEPVNIPVTPMPFSLVDGEGFDGDWQAFCEKLQERENAKTEGDVHTVAELTGVTERTAYRRTETARTANREAEILQVLALKADGKSLRNIREITGFSIGKIQGILNRNQVY